MLKQKGEEGNLFPCFQQEELSVSFLISICPYNDIQSSPSIHVGLVLGPPSLLPRLLPANIRIPECPSPLIKCCSWLSVSVGGFTLAESTNHEWEAGIWRASHNDLSTCAVLSHSVMSDSETSWTVAHQAPLSMGFSRWDYWSGLSRPSPKGLPNPGTEPMSPMLQADSFLSEPRGKPATSLVPVKARLFGCSCCTGRKIPEWKNLPGSPRPLCQVDGQPSDRQSSISRSRGR